MGCVHAADVDKVAEQVPADATRRRSCTARLNAVVVVAAAAGRNAATCQGRNCAAAAGQTWAGERSVAGGGRGARWACS